VPVVTARSRTNMQIPPSGGVAMGATKCTCRASPARRRPLCFNPTCLPGPLCARAALAAPCGVLRVVAARQAAMDVHASLHAHAETPTTDGLNVPYTAPLHTGAIPQPHHHGRVCVPHATGTTAHHPVAWEPPVSPSSFCAATISHAARSAGRPPPHLRPHTQTRRDRNHIAAAPPLTAGELTRPVPSRVA